MGVRVSPLAPLVPDVPRRRSVRETELPPLRNPRVAGIPREIPRRRGIPRDERFGGRPRAATPVRPRGDCAVTAAVTLRRRRSEQIRRMCSVARAAGRQTTRASALRTEPGPSSDGTARLARQSPPEPETKHAVTSSHHVVRTVATRSFTARRTGNGCDGRRRRSPRALALPASAAQSQITLGTTVNFAVLAGSGITNTGATTITGGGARSRRPNESRDRDTHVARHRPRR